MTGDVNGDQQTDVIIVHSDAGTAALFADITHAAPSIRQALSGDQNGDGRQDLISPRVTATGLEIRVFRQLADGTYDALPPADVKLPAGLPAHMPQRGWIVADVNGDHRSDLINLPPDSQTGLELLGTGNDAGQSMLLLSSLKSAAAAGAPATFPAVGRWLVGTRAGDDGDELIHVGEGPFHDGSGAHAHPRRRRRPAARPHRAAPLRRPGITGVPGHEPTPTGRQTPISST